MAPLLEHMYDARILINARALLLSLQSVSRAAVSGNGYIEQREGASTESG